MADRATLARAREDLATFARLVGRPLEPWQARALALKVRTTIVRAPRQSGKSRSLAVLAAHRAYRTPDYRVLVVSGGGEVGARRLLAEVSAIIAGSPFLTASLVDENLGLVRLSNGSEIRCVPASEQQIRGWTADLLIGDEAALIDSALWHGAALMTTAARPDARVVLAGSAGGTTGAFFEADCRGSSGADPDTISFRWRIEDAHWITPEALAALRAGIPPALARAEIDNEYVDFGGGLRLFEDRWIDAAVARDLPGLGSPANRDLPGGGPLRLGVDVARSGPDETVAVAVRGGRVRVAFCGHGWDLMQTAATVAQACAGEAEARVAIDETGLGAGAVDRARQLGVAVSGFVSAARARMPTRYANLRAESYQRLADALRDGHLDIDAGDRALIAQLRSVRWSTDRLGRVLIESKDALRARGVRSPDRVDAVVMALWLDEAWRPAPEPVSDEERRALDLAERVRAAEWAQRGHERWGGDRGSLPPSWSGGSVMADMWDTTF